MTTRGNLRKGNCIYYEINCTYCGEPCLVDSRGKFCSRVCYNLSIQGENHHNWRGGLRIDNPKAYRRKYYEDNKDRELTLGKEWVRSNRDKRAAAQREWARNNPTYQSKWFEENKDKIKATLIRYRLANPEKVKALRDKWHQENPGKRTAYRAKHKALKLNQTPKDADLKVISWFYVICRQRNEQAGKVAYHVDHIIPLSKGGLHHEDNLQILTAHQNLTKSSKIYN